MRHIITTLKRQSVHEALAFMIISLDLEVGLCGAPG